MESKVIISLICLVFAGCAANTTQEQQSTTTSAPDEDETKSKWLIKEGLVFEDEADYLDWKRRQAERERQNQTYQSARQKEDKPQDPVEKLQYEVVGRKITDTENKTQVTVYAIVSGTFTEPGLNSLLEKMYDGANATRDFKYFEGKPTHVAIWLYTSKDDFKSSTGQWIANLQKIGEGSKPEIKVKTHLLAQHNAGPQVKKNLSESKRKEIYKALIAASDRAEAEADRRYPWPGPNDSQATANEKIRKNAEALDALSEKYKSEVAKRYSITQEQRKEINWEGTLKEWPMPPRR